MTVDFYCANCKEMFDAHWHVMPIDKRKCPGCGNIDPAKYFISTDEDKYDLEG